jgi:hypothetical protein
MPRTIYPDTIPHAFRTDHSAFEPTSQGPATSLFRTNAIRRTATTTAVKENLPTPDAPKIPDSPTFEEPIDIDDHFMLRPKRQARMMSDKEKKLLDRRLERTKVLPIEYYKSAETILLKAESENGVKLTAMELLEIAIKHNKRPFLLRRINKSKLNRRT